MDDTSNGTAEDARSDPENGFVSAQYRISLDDYRAMADRQPRFRGRAFAWRPPFIILGIVNMAISLGLVIRSWGAGLYPEAFINAGLGVLMLLFVFVAQPLILRSAYRRQGIGDNRVDFRAGDDGIETRWGGMSSQIAWSAVIGYSVTDTLYLFWINTMQAVIVSRKALSPQGETLLAGHLQAAGVKPL